MVIGYLLMRTVLASPRGHRLSFRIGGDIAITREANAAIN